MPSTCSPARRRRAAALVMMVAATAAPAVCRADGVTRSWAAAGDGTWSDPANWSPAGVPAAGDAVRIFAPATGTRTVTYDYAGPAVTIASLRLSGSNPASLTPAPQSETLLVPGGSLTVGSDIIGFGCRATVAQTGGAVRFVNGLSLGYARNGGSGTYVLSAGTLADYALSLGDDGSSADASTSPSAGTFQQTGGTHTVSGTVSVGQTAAPGSFVMTGGSTSAAAVAIGSTNGRHGTMEVGGTGRLRVSNSLTLFGVDGTTQTNTLTLADGGSITTSALYLPFGGAGFNWTGGALTITGQYVGIGGPVGDVGPDLGPTLTLGPGKSLTVAATPSDPAAGGQKEYVGVSAPATVDQTGGSNTTTRLILGQTTAAGTTRYNLSGGTLTVGLDERVGQSGPTTFTQSGGTHTVPTLNLGLSPTNPVAYTMTGGTLAVGTVSTTLASTFDMTGGTLVGTKSFTVGGRATFGGVQQWAPGATLKVYAAARVTMTSDAGGPTPTAPPLTIDAFGGLLTLAATQHLAGLMVADPASNFSGGTVAVAAGSLLVTPTLAFAGGNGAWRGTLDLGGAADVTSGSLAALTSQAAQGFAGGAWDGPGGIVSASAAADARRLTGVGVIANGSLYATFDGQPVSAADVLARLTYYGDANLDGRVDAADYTRVDAGFVLRLTGWADGDFNYDGAVDASDYTLMDNAFNQQAGDLAPAADAARPATSLATVPETGLVVPAALLATVAALRDRRRRR